MFQETKHTKFSEKRTFLTLWYAHARDIFFWKVTNRIPRRKTSCTNFWRFSNILRASSFPEEIGNCLSAVMVCRHCFPRIFLTIFENITDFGKSLCNQTNDFGQLYSLRIVPTFFEESCQVSCQSDKVATFGGQLMVLCAKKPQKTSH